MKVLIIDDDVAHRETVAMVLKRSRSATFQPLQASTVAEGSELLERTEVDVVLLDMSLPDSKGPEGFRRLFYQYPNTPIIMVSGTKNEDLAYAFIISGAQDYLVKGEYTPESLARAALYACARHTFRRVSTELQHVSRSLAAVTEQLGDMQSKYDALIQSVEGLNRSLTPEGQGNVDDPV